MWFLSLLSIREEKPYITDSYIASFSSFDIDVEAEQIREITFDRNELTVIFPELEGINVEAYISFAEKHIKVGEINKESKIVGIHCGHALFEFRLFSEQSTSTKIDIVADSLRCKQTFYSSKLRERFQISHHQYSNVSLSPTSKICFMHSPPTVVEYNIISHGTGYKLTYSKDDLKPPVLVDYNQMIRNVTDSPLFFVWESVSDVAEAAFQYMTVRSEESFNGISFNYSNTREPYLILENGTRSINLPDFINDQAIFNFNRYDEDDEDLNNEIFKLTAAVDDDASTPTPAPATEGAKANNDKFSTNPSPNLNYSKFKDLNEEDHDFWPEEKHEKGLGDWKNFNDDEDESGFAERNNQNRQASKSNVNIVYFLVFIIIIMIIALTTAIYVYFTLTSTRSRIDPYEAMPLLTHPETLNVQNN